MQHHGNSHVRSSQRKQIVLALSLALGLAANQGQASPSTDTALHHPQGDSPAAALIRNAAAAGIAVPRDLPYFMELAAKRRAETDDARPKATIPVSNCNNSGPGSLRAAIGFASSGDVIDLTGSDCTTINLTSSLVTSVDDLTIRADPSAGNKYTISGGNNGRVFTHNGTGTLTLDGVALAFGKISGNPNGPIRGGCVYSQGSVALINEAQVKYCEARNTRTNGAPSAQGGAIFAADTVSLEDGARVAGGEAISSVGNAQGGGIHATAVSLSGGLVESNSAQVSGASLGGAAGGGIHAGNLDAKYSIVRNNSAIVSESANAMIARSGGAELIGEGISTIKYSTFSGNTANASGAVNGGGAAITFGTSSSATGSLTIKSSTIANNTTINSKKYGGALSLRKDAVIRSSTISGNVERNAPADIASSKYGAGITLDDGVQLTMTSTIVANNNAMRLTGTAALLSDLGLSDPASDIAAVVGTQNFRNFSHENITWPAGNFGSALTSVRLGPLQDNGGLTPTMMPNADSPVIDNGGTTGLGNPLNPGAPLMDQRGEGFPRVFGTQADIGAVEWRLVPEIFADGFESD